MWKKWGAISLIFTTALAIGCADDTRRDTTEEKNPSDSGLLVTVGFDKISPIRGFIFEINKCKGDQVLEAALKQNELSVTQELEGLNGSIYDGDQVRRFADFSARLAAGCYDLRITPIDGDSNPLSSCKVGRARDLKVVKGQSTEVLLSAVCDQKGRKPFPPGKPGKPGTSPGDKNPGGNEDSTGLELQSRLNYPPRIESVYFSPSKFVFDCEIAEICVQAHDPDGDDLEFVFEKVDGPRLWEGPDLTRVERNGDYVTACMEAVAVWEGGYDFKVSVYDRIKVNGKMKRIEDINGQASRAEMAYPLYVNYDIELHCYDPETETYHALGGVRHVERLYGCVTLWPFQYFCSDYWWDDLEETCPEGEFKPETVYPVCEDHQKNNPVPQPWRYPDEPWTGH